MQKSALFQKIQAFIRWFWPAAVVAFLLLTFAQPLMLGKLPVTSDAPFHLYRLVVFDHTVSHGDLWPRYAPGLMFGYGFPVFHFYSPMSLYPMYTLYLLGLDFADAFMGGLIVYVLFGAIGAYLLGKVWGGPLAGIVTAVAYAYSPFLVFQVVEVAAVAQIGGQALLPWILWAFWRLAAYGRRRDFLLAVILFGSLILMHNITAMYTAALLLVYGVFLWWITGKQWQTVKRLALAWGCAMGIATFFWLPALADRQYVYIDRVTYGNLDFHSNFHMLAESFLPPITADPDWYNEPFSISLGWPQAVLGVIGIGFAIWRRNKDDNRPDWRLWVGLAALLIAIMLFLTTRASTWVWENVPLLHYMQHPWRFLGPVSLLLATLAGIGAAQIAGRFKRPILQAGWIAACLIAMILYVLPWLYVEYVPFPTLESIRDVQAFERTPPYYIGTQASGEYTPIWVEKLPDRDMLDPLYAESEVIPRLNASPNSEIESEEWGPKWGRLSLNAYAPTEIVFNWTYFPGWRAKLDGEQIEVWPSEPEGLVEVSIPEGEHTLEVRFGATPIVRWATIASAVIAIIVIALAGFVPSLWASEATPEPSTPAGITPTIAAAILVGVALVLCKVLIFDLIDSPIRRVRFADGVEAGVQVPIRADYDQKVTLLGYDLSRADVPSGGATTITAFWSLSGENLDEDYRLPVDYGSFISLRDPDGNTIYETELRPIDETPTTIWIPDIYVRERLRLKVPDGTPPGSYSIHIRVHDPSQGRDLEAFGPAGNPMSTYVQVGTLNVTRPTLPTRPAALVSETRLMAQLNDELTLIDAAPLPEQSEVGQPLLLIVDWLARSRPQADYLARLVWLDQDNQVAAESLDFSPVSAYPTGQWKKRDVWRGIHRAYIPGRLEPGEYTIALQLISPAGDPVGEQRVIGQMAVSAPERSFDIPEMSITAKVDWQNGVRLLGLDLPADTITPGQDLSLTLYWQPQDDVRDNLTVFMHLIDAEGNIAAQRDQIPGGGARPTLGWSPGEVIADSYSLFIDPVVAPGEYQIRIGWYDAQSGQRVMLADGSDFVVLPVSISVGAAE